jgi:hypothetical protein
MVSRPNVCGSSSRSMESDMPDYGFGRCDGHHKMIDFRLEKSTGLRLFHQRLRSLPGRL